MQDEHIPSDPNVIQLPRPTAWPLVLALGISLIMAGMVTNIAVGILGLVLSIAGASAGSSRCCRTRRTKTSPSSRRGDHRSSTARTLMERQPVIPRATRRARSCPSKPSSITTGIRGGIAGGTAMVVPATLFSLLKYHSLWYSVNLLAAGGFVSWAGASDAFLSQFHLQGVLAGFLIQGFVSLLVGLLVRSDAAHVSQVSDPHGGLHGSAAHYRNRATPRSASSAPSSTSASTGSGSSSRRSPSAWSAATSSTCRPACARRSSGRCRSPSAPASTWRPDEYSPDHARGRRPQ